MNIGALNFIEILPVRPMSVISAPYDVLFAGTSIIVAFGYHITLKVKVYFVYLGPNQLSSPSVTVVV
jgi:hypothetical protein